MKWKIVADTGANLREIENLPENISFSLVPMILHLDEEEILDTTDINIRELNEKVSKSSKAGSACPAPGVYAEHYEGADNVIVVTITSSLSGSYNSAELGKNLALEENPNANIHVFDSLSAGGEMDLLIWKAIELIEAGKDFQEVVDGLTEYHKTTRVGYMLKSIENLVKNGRVSKFVGSVVGMLNIHVIGVRSDEGTVEMSNRARGEKRALNTFVNDIIENGFNGRILEIAHVDNEELAKKFADKMREKFPDVKVNIRLTSGLCSFYAERGGLMVGYERNI